MFINVDNVIIDLKSFFNDKKEYENNILLLNKQMNNIYASWSGNIAESFKQSYDKEDSSNQILIEQMNKIYDLINTSINSYANIASKIEVNINSKDEIINCLDNLILRVNKILNLIDGNKDLSVVLTYIKYIKKLLETIKNNISAFFKKIEIIENELNNKINALDNIDIKDYELEILDYQKDLNQINNDEIIKSKELINKLRDDEESILITINKTLENIFSNFKVTKQDRLQELCSNLLIEGKKLNKNRESYIIVLNDALLAFNNSVKTTVSLLDKE